MHTSRGHTLTELLVSFFILAIITTAAVPWFGDFLQQNRSITLVNRFITSLHVARMEAIKHNHTVTLCKSSNMHSCSGSWSDGWLIFADRDGDRILDAEDSLLDVTSLARSFNHVLSWKAFRSRNYIQFDAMGFIHSNNGTMVICPPGGKARLARAVIVNRMGRARVSKDSNHDGIHEDAAGRPINCG